MIRIAAFCLALPALFGTADARKGEKGKTPILGWYFPTRPTPPAAPISSRDAIPCYSRRRNTWCTEDSCGVDWCTSKEILDVASTIKSSGLQAIGYVSQRDSGRASVCSA